MWGMGYGGCEPKLEGIVQCTKRYCTMLRKIKKKCGARGRGNIEPKTLNVFFKKREQKIFFDRAGIRTHDLQVRKTFYIIH